MGDKLLKTLNKSLFKVSVKELHIIGTGIKELADNVFKHILSYLDNVVKLCECYLGLDVPELGKVLWSIGVLGSE